jgi:hypothetical protein
MRERASNLLVQLFLVLVRAVNIEPCRTHEHILLFHMRLTQPGGPGPRIYTPRNGIAQLQK